MILLPAIDLKNGKCVRLLQGDANKETVYSENPVDVAISFKNAGAEWIHVIDLNGAFSGERRHTKIVQEIINATGLNIEIGGGIRELSDIETCLEAGVKRVILGTSAHKKPELVKEAVEKFGGEKIAVGIDCRDGKVAIKGWTEITETSVIDLAQKVVDAGVKTIIHTDIAVDGMLSGPDVKTVTELIEKFDVNIIASGGIANLTHIEELLNVKPHAPYGCITGKAIYTGSLNLEEAVKLVKSY